MSQRTQAITRSLVGSTMTRSTRAAVAPLAQAMEAATRAMGSEARPNVKAATNATLSLRTLLPSLIDADGYIRNLTPDAVSSEATTLELALLESARTVEAGAQLIVLPAEEVADTGYAPVIVERPSGLISIDPAPFAVVADGDDVAESAMPTSEALVDREAGTQYGFRVTFTRREIKAKGWDVLAAEMMTSIAAGLARAVDSHLLSAIAATTPPTYTLAAAAAAGCRFGELRALIGRDLAEVPDSYMKISADSGQLRVNGVPAELTPFAADTVYLGDWSRYGVAVHDSIDLLLERTSAAGEVVVTCWLDLHALVPDAGRMWKWDGVA